jgi:hypothetical protein
LKQHIPPSELIETLHAQPGVTYAQITKQNSYAPTNIQQEPYQQTSSMHDFKNMLKSLFEQLETMLNLLTTVLTRFKQWLNSYLLEHQRPNTRYRRTGKFTSIHDIYIMLISEMLFTEQSNVKLSNYTVYHMNQPAGTTQGRTAMILKIPSSITN